MDSGLDEATADTWVAAWERLAAQYRLDRGSDN